MTPSLPGPWRRPPGWALGAGLVLALATGPAAAAEVVRLQRPDPPGTVTEVKLGMFVMDVASIDDAAQTFHADFFVIRRWHDARLSFDASSVSGALRILPASEVWQPDLEILNQRLLRATLPEQVYFVWKLFVPLTLIVFMAWTVFFIGHDQMGPRIGISTASIFTLIAFQFSLGRVLPPISYLTRADQFVLGSSVLVYLALAETIFSGKLKAGGRAELAQQIDWHARWIYATLFVLVAAVTLLL